MPNQSKTLLNNLLNTVDLNQLSSIQIQLVIAIRIAVLAKRKNVNVDVFLKKHFGNASCVHHFKHLIEITNEAWPEHFYVKNPCCKKLSYDEMLIIDLIHAASANRYQYFHALLCEMISKTDCDRLHHVIKKLTESLNSNGATL